MSDDPTVITSSDTGDSSSSALSPRETVGIIVGIASIATILIMVVLYALMICKYCFYKRRRRQMLQPPSYFDSHGSTRASFKREFSHNNSFSMSPQGGYTPTLDTTVVSRQQSTDAARALNEEDIRQQRRRTYIGSRQFPSKNLVLMTILGDGEYGPVYRGEAYDITPKEASRIVTVKMLKSDADDAMRVKFEQEITLFSHLNHLNVAGVLGVCTDSTPECIIFDAGDTHIDLLAYIRDKGLAMKGVSDGERIVHECRDMLRIADEVCLGVAYLASQHIVHKDIALRNCIRGKNGVVKVANFGLGSKLYPESYYRLHGRSLPLRWLPPEAINYDVFSTESDVWAFGVLMWELFTYGEHPHPTLTNQEVFLKVSQQFYVPSPPDTCPQDVFLVMSSCWDRDPVARPNFLALHQHIFDLISPHLMEDHGD